MKDQLLNLGWVDKGDVLVRYSNPRLGWKPSDGTLIIGYHEYPKKVHTINELEKAMNNTYGSPALFDEILKRVDPEVYAQVSRAVDCAYLKAGQCSISKRDCNPKGCKKWKHYKDKDSV